MMASNKLRHVCVLLGALALLTGCGSNPVVEQDTPALKTDTDSHAPARAFAACINEKGWDVKVDESDGSLPFEGTPAQMDQYQQDVAECTERQAPTIKQNDFSAEQWAGFYEEEVSRAECLRAEGINIPDVPSLQAFIDGALGSAPWTAYSFVTGQSEENWKRLNAICPQ